MAEELRYTEFTYAYDQFTVFFYGDRIFIGGKDYCNNIAPSETDRTCRKVGAHRKEAQGKGNRTPATKEYDRTYNRLKVRKQRGKISKDEWNAALSKAQKLLELSERGELTDEELKRKLEEL